MRSLLPLVGVALLCALVWAPSASAARPAASSSSAAAPVPAAAARPAPDGDLLQDIGVDADEHNEQAMLKFSGYSTSLHSPHLSLTVRDSECCDCVSSVGHHILSEAIQAVTDACQDVTCPVIKQRCDWMLAHPGEMKGYLAVRLRPFSYAYMYCLGNATCEHPSKASPSMSTALLVADTTAHPELLLSQLSAAAPFLERAMRTKLSKDGKPIAAEASATPIVLDEQDGPADLRISTLARRIGEGEAHHHSREIDHSDSDSTDDAGDKKKKCHKCLRKSVRWLLRRAEEKLQEVCDNTECPELKKFCDWSAKHPHITRGMLYAYMQPWKMATGWCFGKGKCKCDDDEQSVFNAPFTMGECDATEKHKKDKKKEKHEAPKPLPPTPVVPLPPVQPADSPTTTPAVPTQTKPQRPMFGRGKHDRSFGWKWRGWKNWKKQHKP